MVRFVTVAVYLVCLAAAVAAEVVARWEPDRFATFSSLLDRVMATRSARFGILTLWWWAGWHFLVGQTV